MSCPSTTCCPPSPFTTVGKTAAPSANSCNAASCCPSTVFTLIQIPKVPIPYIAGEGAKEPITGEGGEFIVGEF